MKPVTSNYNRTQIIKLGILTTGALLCLIPLICLPSIAEASPSHKIIQLAALNDCVNDISEGFSVETKNYSVGICFKNSGIFYIGRTKKSKTPIVLPATYNKKKNLYLAKNGQYTYTLDMRNKQLVIKLPNGKLAIEKVIREIDS